MKLSEIMRRTKIITENNRVIVNISFADIGNEDDVKDVSKYIQSFVTRIPKNAYYLNFNTNGLLVNNEIKEMLKKTILDCGSHFKASAVVVDKNTALMMKAIAKDLSLKKMQTYTDSESAKKFLLSDKSSDIGAV